jgi:polyisoprenoid-binding protein YceI
MRKLIVLFAVVAAVIVLRVAVSAQAREIDPANSRITIHAYKTGVFSFAAHDHVVEAPIRSGQVDEAGKSTVVEIETKSLRVLDPNESAKNRAEIQKTMLSDKLLDAEKHPTISFHSTSFKAQAGDAAEVKGQLSLHGQVHPVTLAVKKEGERWTGSTRLKQTEFGMQPVSLAGGTVKVKDEVRLEFNVGLKAQ